MLSENQSQNITTFIYHFIKGKWQGQEADWELGLGVEIDCGSTVKELFRAIDSSVS